MVEEETGRTITLDEIHEMLKIMMKKLDKLDVIENRIKVVEEDLKDVKDSIEHAHAEIIELKEGHEATKAKNKETKERLDKIENENAAIHNSIVDLKARSMRSNLYNIPEYERENTTTIIHELLEDKMDMQDAKTKVKIDLSHRLGKKRNANTKPRPIVVKFNYHQD